MISIRTSSFKSPKAILSILLAAAMIISTTIFFGDSIAGIAAGVCFAAICLFAGFFQIETKTTLGAVVLNLVWGACCIAGIVFASVPWMTSLENFIKILLNYWCTLLVVTVVFLLLARWRISVTLAVAAMAILYIVNCAVLEFRGREILPSDFLSLKTALSVADRYVLTISSRFFLTAIITIAGLFSQCALPAFPETKRTKRIARIITALFLVISMWVLPRKLDKILIEVWGNDPTAHNGFFLNFCIGLRMLRVEEPEGYSPERIDEISEQYDVQSEGENRRPNIIVIMNEAYGDLNIFENDLRTNVTVTPYIDSLTENTVKGYALSSIYGGNTVNSEFEFLTGHSMRWFPENAVPYQQYLREKVFSLPWVLKDLGYTTFSTHPYYGSGYSRDKVHGYLGFSKTTFIDDYPQEDLIREYVSDQEMYEYILKYLSEDQSDDPQFVFGITIQNHGGYIYEDYQSTIHLEGYKGEYPDVEQYLSVLFETDRAVEYLLTTLEEFPEDTIVLFYGDHLPALSTAFLEELNGGTLESLEERMLMHTVPFFIWTNYDIQSDFVACTSLPYLGRYLLEYAGLELPAYYQMLKDIEATIPSINTYGYYSTSQGKFIPIQDATGKEAEMLELYRIVQYQNLFDSENRSWNFYERYLPSQ